MEIKYKKIKKHKKTHIEFESYMEKSHFLIKLLKKKLGTNIQELEIVEKEIEEIEEKGKAIDPNGDLVDPLLNGLLNTPNKVIINGRHVVSST